MIRTEKNGVSWYEFSIFGSDVRGVVTTRRGGVSRGIYENLNMSFFLGDEEAHVKENRIRVMQALGARAERAVGAAQVHGTHIAIVDESMAGRGGLSAKGAIPDTDGLITNVPGIPLILLFADCTPLLFSNPVQGVIGVAHGGWRGSAGNIVGKMIEKMKAGYGCRPEDIRLGIGPCICLESLKWVRRSCRLLHRSFPIISWCGFPLRLLMGNICLTCRLPMPGWPCGQALQKSILKCQA